MASRNFNYTGRMLITQECIDARLCEINQKAPLLDVDFDWSMKPSLEQIPPNAKLFVDVGKDMSFMRFDYGTFGNPVKPNNLSLSELDSWTSASFVVRVVDDGNLLAASKKHTVSIAQPDLKSRRSLIIADYEDLGERPWKLEVYEEIELPKLVFNQKWWDAAMESNKPLQEDSKVMGMIMPNFFKRYLFIHNWTIICWGCSRNILACCRVWGALFLPSYRNTQSLCSC